MEPFSLKLELRIDWSEIDLFGHVNNLSIQKYIQSAKVNYLEAIGLMPSQSAIKVGPTLVSSTCQFRKMSFYPGNVTIWSKVDLIKTTSFRILHKIMNDQNEIVAEAQDIIVLFDFEKNTKRVIPEEIKKKIIELGMTM
ncbi:MAG TPA: acyl-CoA thioesterase [Prolixibacteraceae bacterium]|jgi:acyl-CoA thioester hydrolase